MNKWILLMCVLIFNGYFGDEELKENEEVDEGISNTISDLDSTEFVKALEKQLS